MHKAFYLRDVIDRLDVPSKEGRGGLACIEDGIAATIQGHEQYTKKNKERQYIC